MMVKKVFFAIREQSNAANIYAYISNLGGIDLMIWTDFCI